MVRALFALILTLMLAPQALWAEALPQSVGTVLCEPLFEGLALESPEAVLRKAISQARAHLQNGGLESNFNQFFKPKPFIIKFIQKNYDDDLAILKAEKLELVDLLESKLNEKTRHGELDERWILKFTATYSWIVDFAIVKGINLRIEGNKRHFYDWGEVEQIFELTRLDHEHARQELENDKFEIIGLRELYHFNKSFHLQPHVGSLSKRDIVFGILNKVHFAELTLKANYADNFYLAPRAFMSHDLAHALNILEYLDVPTHSESFEKFRLAFLSGYQDPASKVQVLDEWTIEFLFYVLHEEPNEFIMNFDYGVKPALKAQAAALRMFNNHLKRNNMPSIMKEEFDLLLRHIFDILGRGGF